MYPCHVPVPQTGTYRKSLQLGYLHKKPSMCSHESKARKCEERPRGKLAGAVLRAETRVPLAAKLEKGKPHWLGLAQRSPERRHGRKMLRPTVPTRAIDEGSTCPLRVIWWAGLGWRGMDRSDVGRRHVRRGARHPRTRTVSGILAVDCLVSLRWMLVLDRMVQCQSCGTVSKWRHKCNSFPGAICPSQRLHHALFLFWNRNMGSKHVAPRDCRGLMQSS